MKKRHPLPHPNHEWEAIIGLEIHAELNTKSKMYSSAPNHFGDEPNTNISDVDIAIPGSLPVLNEEAVKKAVQFGCAVGGEVATFSQFDRKSYFYPDNPRNFQITQYEHPIVKGGSIIAVVGNVEQEFQITRAHLEDDSGSLKHFSNFAGVDFNRAGVPLLEIVSEPCMHTPQEASSYAMGIKAILEYIDASDCNMQEGSLRFDVNVSVRKLHETEFRNKIEIKNLNSFSNLELAILHEIKRQIQEYEKYPNKDPKEVITQATFRFDPDKNETILMRKKECADDYRYFPEPDLLPLILTTEYIENIRKTLPELPLQKEKRFVEQLGLSAGIAYALVCDKKVAEYFESALHGSSNAKNLANWIVVEFPGRLNPLNKTLHSSAILPKHVAKLVDLIDKEVINGKIAKSIADDMVQSPGKDPEDIVKENPHYAPITSRDTLLPIIDNVISLNTQSVQDYLAGRDRAFAFLVGKVMKETKGSASPKIVNELLIERIQESQKK